MKHFGLNTHCPDFSKNYTAFLEIFLPDDYNFNNKYLVNSFFSNLSRNHNTIMGKKISGNKMRYIKNRCLH